MFSSATTETATMVVRLFVASREVFVASRRNYEITADFILHKVVLNTIDDTGSSTDGVTRRYRTLDVTFTVLGSVRVLHRVD